MTRCLIVLLSVTALAAAQTHIVTQVGLNFVDSVSGTAVTTIPTGTTVQWVHTTGMHTVTSGTGSADPSSGVLFDSPLTFTNPTSSFTFNTPGIVPYHCTPHELFGMTGTIEVVDNFLSITSPSPGTVQVDLAAFTPGANWRLLISFVQQNPTGSGVLFGVGGDAWPQIFAPLFQGNIGANGTDSVTIPGVPPGFNVDVVTLSIVGGVSLDGVSNVVPFST